MAQFSHSRLETYENCPQQYKYRYIDEVKVELEDTIEAFLGSRVHEALEKLYRDLRFEKLLSLEELLAYFNGLWVKNWSDSILFVRKDYSAENFRQMGERYLRDYYQRYKPFNQGRVLGLETKDYLPLDEEGKYVFHIRIDRLIDIGDGFYEVHDYKTSNSLPKIEELEKDRQLAIYSLWVSQRFRDFQKARLVWHYLAFDKELDSWRTGEELEDARKKVLEDIGKVESETNFFPRVSEFCDWCFYRHLCPQWKHGVELEEKSPNEYLNDPGVKLVNEYAKVRGELEEYKAKAEEKLEKLKEALIEFSRREGVQVVFGSDKKVTLREYESIRYPAKDSPERKELVEVLKSLGKLDQVSELDLNALARAVKNREWEESELELVRRFETGERAYRLTVSKK